jgi:cell division protein FtsZ
MGSTMERNDILVIGIGGSGGRLVDALAACAPEAVRTAMIDTDAAALAASQAISKLQIGSHVTNGQGTGGDAGLARRAATDDAEIIRGLFSDARLVVVLAGLGGGTGSAVTPEVIKAAGLSGTPTLCVATQPFAFEGAPRAALARAAVPEIREAADGLILIPNDKLFKSVGADKVTEAFPAADAALGMSVLALWQILTRPGYLNAGPSDLAQVTKPERGIATMAWAEAHGRKRGASAVKQLLTHPMLDGGAALGECRSIMVSIVGGEDLTLKDLADIMAPIKAACHERVVITLGTSIDPEWKARLLLTLIAARPGGWSGAIEMHPLNAQEPTDLPLTENPAVVSRGGVQTTLQLEPAGRGRFAHTDPTLLDGEDLDIPTYQRRGIKL